MMEREWGDENLRELLKKYPEFKCNVVKVKGNRRDGK